MYLFIYFFLIYLFIYFIFLFIYLFIYYNHMHALLPTRYLEWLKILNRLLY